VVEAVGAVAPAAVGDDDRDVALERALQEVGQLVERLADELLEVGVLVGVELGELHLVRLGGGALAGETLRPLDDALEVLLALRVLPAGHPHADRAHRAAHAEDEQHQERGALDEPDRRGVAEAAQGGDDREPCGEGDGGGEQDAPEVHRLLAITSRWISFVPS
jgi:hypothetical protein